MIYILLLLWAIEDFTVRKLFYIKLEELCVERAVPKSVGINTLNHLLFDMCQAAGIKRKTGYCLRVTCASSLFNASVARKLICDRIGHTITVLGEVEKVSRNVDIPCQFVSVSLVIVL